MRTSDPEPRKQLPDQAPNQTLGLLGHAPECSKEVIQQRITAARHLRGKLQSDLDRELAAYGFSLKEAGDLERGAKTLQPMHVGPLAQILQVPEAWFTSEIST
jgi:hypothetical protein